MFTPYSFFVEADFLAYQKGSSTCSDLSKYADEFPILDHYLFIPTPSSHYLVFRTIIAEYLANQQNLPLKKLLTEFTKEMPNYPPEIIHPFSESVSIILQKSVPEIFATITLKNPGLIPQSSSQDPIQQIIRDIFIQKDIDQNIQSLNNSITNQTASENAELIGKMVEELFLNNKASTDVFLLMKTLLSSIPKTLLFLNLPFPQSPDFLKLQPIFCYSKDTINREFLSNLELFKFAYLVVERMQTDHSIESVIPLHRLSVSGSAAIEAIIFALAQFPNTLNFFLEKNTPDDSRIALGAIFACILTCVEIPQIKSYVIENKDRIVKYFERLFNQVKTPPILVSSFRAILYLFSDHGITPLNLVYSHWLGTSHKFLILNCLRTISPLDPSFLVLLTECSEYLIDFPYVICEMVRKVVFNPSIVKRKAIRALANAVQTKMNEFILFADFIRKTDLYFYAIHLIYNFTETPDFSQEGMEDAVKNIIFVSLLSESVYSAQHLETFSEWLSKYKEDDIIQLMEKCITFKDSRLMSRMFFLLTYMSNIAEYILNNPKFASHFEKSFKEFYSTYNEKLASSLSISWHNFFMSIDKNPQTIKLNNEIRRIFAFGTETLISLWNNQNKIMIDAFCDALSNEDTRKIIIGCSTVKQIDNSQFCDCLMATDSESTLKKFPGLQYGRHVENTSSDRPAPSKYGWTYWTSSTTFAYGEVLSVTI